MLRAPYAHEGSPAGGWGPFTWGWPSGPDGKKTFNLVRFSVFSVMQPRLVPVKQSPAMLHEWIDVHSPLSMGGCKTVLENPTELTSLISAAGKTFRKWLDISCHLFVHMVFAPCSGVMYLGFEVFDGGSYPRLHFHVHSSLPSLPCRSVKCLILCCVRSVPLFYFSLSGFRVLPSGLRDGVQV